MRAEPESVASDTALRVALAHKSPHVVAKAARIIAEAALSAFDTDLCAAFDRLMEDPADRDKGCVGKMALAEALYDLEHDAEDLFLRGVRHVQMEKAYPKPVDTAAGLRGACAMGLVRVGYRDVLDELADLLADPEPVARAAAARALGAYGQRDAGPLARLKVRTGDEDPDVLSDCMTAWLRIGDPDALDHVAGCLRGPPDLQRAAAFALGASERSDAFAALHAWTTRVPHQPEELGMTAIAMLRTDEGFDFLLEIVDQAPRAAAHAAVKAIAAYGRAGLRERVESAVDRRQQRGDGDLGDAVARAFGLPT